MLRKMHMGPKKGEMINFCLTCLVRTSFKCLQYYRIPDLCGVRFGISTEVSKLSPLRILKSVWSIGRIITIKTILLLYNSYTTVVMIAIQIVTIDRFSFFRDWDNDQLRRIVVKQPTTPL